MPRTDTASTPQEQAFRSVRRAFRLRRVRDGLLGPAHTLRDAIASGIPERDRPGRREQTIRGQVELHVLMAAEQAGVPEDRGREMTDWTMLHLFPDAEAKPDAKLPVPDRVKIQIEAGQLTLQVDTAEAALLAAGLGLYQRGGVLVRLGWAEAGAGETPKLIPVDEAHLLELIGRATEWIKRDARQKGYVPTSCPRDVATAYLARGGLEWRVPHLAGVIGAATLREDGTLLNVPGYDADTGLYLAVGECEAGCGQNPSRDDAEDAAETLGELLEGFPFVGPADRAVALAAILTAVVRRSLPTAPLFAFTAPTPGTGKSLLVDLVSLIATGDTARGFTWSGDPQEDRKALDAALLEGAAVISLDNVTAPLGGDRLNQILTQGSATVRVLGQSKNVEVRCGAFVIANGNNLAIAADLTRRTMLCSMDAKVERPELREFKADPLAMVRADRGRYLSAALTILRAYHVAGRPAQPKALGSFAAWSGWVRGAVMWLGHADPVASQDAAREIDPRGAELAAVLGQWNEVIGDRRVTSAQLIEGATAGAVEFREALLAAAGAGGAINTRRLGMWLHANKSRVVGALRIEPAGKTRDSAAMWCLSGGRRASEVRKFPGGEFLEALP